MPNPGPEGIPFAGGEHLPDARILEHLSIGELPKLGSTVWELPDHPDAVLRLQRGLPKDVEACWDLAREGITHLAELRDRGLPMPAQRYVTGPDPYLGQKRQLLYTITERIDGRQVTYGQEDGPYAERIITASAGYILQRVLNPSSDKFLFETGYPWQNTVLANTAGQRVDDRLRLHDTSIEFANLHAPITAGTLRYASVSMLQWARVAAIEPPKVLHELVRTVEPRPQRLWRTVRGLVQPRHKQPPQIPDGWKGI